MITIDINGRTLTLDEKDVHGLRFTDAGDRVSVTDGTSLWSFFGERDDGTRIPIHVDVGESEHELILYIDGERIPVRLETDRDRHVAELQNQTASARPH